MSLAQEIVASKDLAEALSYWATAGGIVVAITAGIGAVVQIYFEQRRERWARARDLYDSFMLLSIDHPEFYRDFWVNGQADDISRESYKNFVSYLLTAIEDIVLMDGRPEWRNSLLSDLRPHVSYFQSQEFAADRCCYFSEVRDLIDAVLNERRGVSNA